jgi:hypothetical protein
MSVLRIGILRRRKMIAENYEQSSCETDACNSQFSNYLHHGSEQFSHMMEDRPGQSVLFATLAGFGVGLVLSRFLVAEEAPSHSAFDRTTAERFGRQLLERVEQAMPAMLREKLGR